jgi:hypothetical protein
MNAKRSTKVRIVGAVGATLFAAYALLATGCASSIPNVPGPGQEQRK